MPPAVWIVETTKDLSLAFDGNIWLVGKVTFAPFPLF